MNYSLVHDERGLYTAFIYYTSYCLDSSPLRILSPSLRPGIEATQYALLQFYTIYDYSTKVFRLK